MKRDERARLRDRSAHIVEAAARLERRERDAYIVQACAGDARLLDEVRALLAASDAAGGFLGAVTASVEPFNPASDGHHPDRIGAYRILQKIGEGGFGVVYMAEQERPVRRRVAVKIVKPGMDTKEVLARFQAERQALAMMDHPNIARVFDAGETENGRPYFVMELVRGIAITKYCDEARLGIRDRLHLFRTACLAVQHAHQKGLIHRDIKPNNIMVTLHDTVPVPKIIDFGIAKATTQRLTDRTLFTAYGQFIGTPQYMSPEQAEMSGLDVDTRSDIYSLGVLLYELLTGTTPLAAESIKAATFAEVQRLVRETEPPRPSTRVSTLATSTSVAMARDTEPKRLGLAIRGDLDWIVLKALEKDRTRRYDTAKGLANDIDNYLNDEPVNATPPSAFYKLSKFVRRNRVAVTAASVVLGVLVLGVIGTTVGMVWALAEQRRANDARRTAEQSAMSEMEARQSESEQRRLAEQQAAEAERAAHEAAIAQRNAEAVSDFLVDLISSVDPRYESEFFMASPAALGRSETDVAVDGLAGLGARPGGREVRVVDLLDRAAAIVPTAFADEPEVRLVLHEALAQAYWTLDRRRKMGEENLAIFKTLAELKGSESIEANRARSYCVWLYGEAGHKMTREAYEIALRREPPDRLERLETTRRFIWTIGTSHARQPTSATGAMRIAIGRREFEYWDLGPSRVGTFDRETEHNLRFIAWMLGSSSVAIGRFAEGLQRWIDYLGADSANPDDHWRAKSFWTLGRLASTYQRIGRPEDAERVLRIGLQVSRDYHQDDSAPHVCDYLLALGRLLRARGQPEKAVPLLNRCLEGMTDRRYWDEHRAAQQGALARRELALAYAEAGRTTDADRVFREAHAECIKLFGPSSDEATFTWHDWMRWQGFGTPRDWTDPSLREQVAFQFFDFLASHPRIITDGDELDWSRMVVEISPLIEDTPNAESSACRTLRFEGPTAARSGRLPDEPGLYRLSLRAPARVEGGRDLHSVSSFLVADWRIRFFRSPSDLGIFPDAWKEAMDDPGPVAYRPVLTLRRTQHAIREVPGWRDFAAIADARVTLPPGRYVVGTQARGTPRVFVNDAFVTNGEVISVGDAPVDLRIELAVSEDFCRFGLEIEPEGLAPLRSSRDTTSTEAGLGRDHWMAAAATVRNEIDTAEAGSPEDRHALTDRMNYLAWVLDKHLDDPGAALPVLKQAEAIRRDLYPDPGHWARRWEENRIAEIVARINDVKLLREGYERAMRRGTLHRVPQARVALQLAITLRDEGRIEEALRIERAAISAVRDAAKRGEGMPAAHAYGILQHFTEAGILTTGREIAELAIQLAEDVFGVASVEYTFRLNELGKLLTRCGEPREALEPLRRSREIRVELLGEDHAEVGWVDDLIADALEESGDIEASTALRHALVERFQREYGSIHDDTCQAFDELVESMQRSGRSADAAATIRNEIDRLSTPPFNGSHNAFRIRQLQENVAQLKQSQSAGR